MDPVTAVGLAASIATILQLTDSVLSYFSDLKSSSKDQAKLLNEAAQLYGLLTVLEHRVKNANGDDEWFKTIRLLGAEQGPLDQIKSDLMWLAVRLAPENRLQKLSRQVTWSLNKPEFDRIFSSIERAKNHTTLALTNDLFTLSKVIKQDTNTIAQHAPKISSSVAYLELEQRLAQKKRVEDWFSGIDFRLKQEKIFELRQPGTGFWFLESHDFLSWINGHGLKVFWCPGIPGAGKTVLATIVVDHLSRLKNSAEATVACLFCDHNERERQSAENFLANLIKQCLQDSFEDRVPEEIVNFQKIDKKPNWNQLCAIFRGQISKFAITFVIIDALDETPENGSIRQQLLPFLESLPVRLLITSRYDRAIERKFIDAQRLDIEAKEQDIRSYVTGRIPVEPTLDLELKREIIEKVAQAAKGMFLMAKFHIDSLLDKTTMKRLRQALEQLPPGLDNSYDAIWERIQSQPQGHRELATKVLIWTCNSYRPLSFDALRLALAIEPGMVETDLDTEDLDDEEILLSACAGLVNIDKQSNALRLVHYTAREYFRKNGAKILSNTQGVISSACITYLSFNMFGSDSSTLERELRLRFDSWDPWKLSKHYDLFMYAACYWGAHSRGDNENTLMDLTLKFLGQALNVENAYKAMRHSQILEELQLAPNEYSSRCISGLHLASFFGLRHVVVALLQKGAPADSPNDSGHTPLMWAAAKDHGSIVTLLLARSDVSVNARAKTGPGTALHYAAFHGHNDIIRQLLAKGADVNIQGPHGTPLCAAVRAWQVTTAELLLKYGADIEGRHETTEWKREVPRPRWTPLFVAVAATMPAKLPISMEMFGLLERNGANFHAIGDKGQTVLHEAMWQEDLQIIESLLSHGLDVNAKDVAGSTPLHYARHNSVIQLLVDNGAIVDARNIAGETPLHMEYECSGGSDKTRLLLKLGADCNAKDTNGNTSLLHALRSRHTTTQDVGHLLRHGSTLSECNNDGVSAVHMVMMKPYGSRPFPRSVLKFLVEEGADVNAINLQGWTPLHYAVQNAQVENAEYLLSVGAQTKIQDIDGRTPLDIAVGPLPLNLLEKRIFPYDYNHSQHLLNMFRKRLADLLESAVKKINREPLRSETLQKQYSVLREIQSRWASTPSSEFDLPASELEEYQNLAQEYQLELRRQKEVPRS